MYNIISLYEYIATESDYTYVLIQVCVGNKMSYSILLKQMYFHFLRFDLTYPLLIVCVNLVANWKKNNYYNNS